MKPATVVSRTLKMETPISSGCNTCEIYAITDVTHLFFHSILMVAIGQVEAHGIGEVEVNLVDVPMPFPKLAQSLLFFVLR